MGLHFVGKWRNEDTASVWCLSNQTKPTHRRSPLSQWAADQRLPIGPFWQLPNGWQSSPHALQFASTRYLVRSVKKKKRKQTKQKESHFPFFDVFQTQSIQQSWTKNKKPVDLPLTSVRLITSAVPTTRQQHNAREKDITTRFVIRRQSPTQNCPLPPAIFHRRPQCSSKYFKRAHP